MHEIKGKGAMTRSSTEAYCEAVWDSVLCWPAIPAGQTAWRSCRQVLQYAAIPDVKNVVLPLEAKAYRVCNENGVWLWGNWTNYDACVNFTTPVMSFYAKCHIFRK
ncbi:calcitonin receptor [Trichonephila inaurata madagascariensis]|uniref:Calcitonin receptor n=1 Tax=Trichonephila inaurata madagascariensis TaxID=2747483 RepID=A0A8X6YEH6_9ARAC|nr:calcitonin receptor [Trichonephila inaurata madagascariensis]